MKKIFTLCFVLLSFAAAAQAPNMALNFSGLQPAKAGFGNITALNGATSFTFEAWVYIDQWKENSYIFSKSASTSNRIDLQLGPAASRRLYFHIANGSNAYAAADNSSISVGKWHHIAAAYDGTQGAYNMVRLYIDGVPASLWYSTGNGTVAGQTPVTSAAFELGPNGFDGRLDEVRIWNKKLAQQELNYRNTINEYHSLYSHLVAYWKMDQGNSALVDYKGSAHGSLTDVSLTNVTDNDSLRYHIVSSYIRANFYESGQISREAVLNNNDLVYLACNPYADGDIFFDLPVNDGALANATHLASHAGRSGVLSFGGAGAGMNAGLHLLNTATAGVSAFTFATWVYIDQWEENSYIFRKHSSVSNRIDLQLGPAATATLYFHVANGANNYVRVDQSGLVPGAWHHVAVTYAGGAGAYNQVKVYVDGVSKSMTYASGNGLLPATGPFIRSDFELGVNFSGKLDETSLNQLSLSATEVNNIKNNPIVVSSWNQTKTNAYWKYDDPARPGKDSRTWLGVTGSLRQTLNAKNGGLLRLGVSSGGWKTMMQTDAARRKFAGNIKRLVTAHLLDGVDLDFEWCETAQEWANYSQLILALNDSLTASSIYSVTLHPLYYQISAGAISALDFISIQSYGPSPVRFPYNEFVNNVSAMLSYGYPKNKLVMGLPFYAVTSDNTKITTSYKNIVNAYPGLDPDLDEVSMNLGGTAKNVTFNGQSTIARKTKYVRDQGLAGVMYWDLATDADVTHSLSLLRSLNTVMNANVDSIYASAARMAPPPGTPGVYENAAAEEMPGLFRVYPNPSSGQVYANIPPGKGRRLQVLSRSGEVMLSMPVTEGGRKQLDISRLAAGLYLVVYEDAAGNRQTQKLIIP